ncbi:hypothetical protein ACHAWF_016007 [Thalassiosira exigua]
MSMVPMVARFSGAVYVALLAALTIHVVGAFSAQPTPFPKPPPLPATDDPHTLLGFDPLSPPQDLRLVQRAYRDLARRYHPDAAVGPDATAEERHRANSDFARIN